MDSVRPLRELFDHLATRAADSADGAAPAPRAALDQAGHGDLPADLVAEALVSYAATATPDVAERLGPFVTAHSGVPTPDGDPAGPVSVAEGFGLLTAAVAPDPPDPFDELGPDTLGPDTLALDRLALDDGAPAAGDLPDRAPDGTADRTQDDDFVAGFGTGTGTGPDDDAAEPGQPDQTGVLDQTGLLDQPEDEVSEPEEPEQLPGFGTGWGPGPDLEPDLPDSPDLPDDLGLNS